MDAVTPRRAQIDSILAAALRNQSAAWPPDWTDDAVVEEALARIAYHGVAGLLTESADLLSGWPVSIREKIREQSLARSMWELRHKIVLGGVLTGLSTSGITSLLLKGSALAYDLYRNPAARERGDTDLLVDKQDRHAARRVLAICAFEREVETQELPDALRSQEIWTFTSDDGTSHSIDLHWQPLNAPALDRHLTFGEMTAGVRPLQRLSEAARVPSRPMMLLHACLHRGLHDCAPYFVGRETYFGGNRLIWLHDLVLLGRAMSDDDWNDFCRMAVDKRVADVCADGLSAAEFRLGCFCPAFVRDELGSGEAGAYFRSGQFGRAMRDMLAVPGWQRKCEYLWARSLPTLGFMRAKYPEMSARPLSALYLRRFVELLRARPGQNL